VAERIFDEDPNLHEEAEAERARYRSNNQGSGPKQLLKPINPATIYGPAPPVRWLVDDWVPLGRVTGLYGVGGAGKTLLIQMLATSCAIGRPWLGIPTMRARSILFFCEDDLDEMHKRQEHINRHYECSMSDLEPMLWLPRLGDDNILMDFAGPPAVTKVFHELVDTARDHGTQLVGIDTLADVFGGSENDRGQARNFAQQALGFLARETKGSVLALAHPSRIGVTSGTGESGSTGWDGAFRSRLYQEIPKPEAGDDPDQGLRILTRKKANWARRDDTISMHWSDGVFIPDQVSTDIIASIEKKTAQRVFLDLLDRVTTEGQHVTSVTSGNYAPRIFASRPDRERFTKADFEKAMHALFADGEIRIETYKHVSRHYREHLVRVVK
jgi:RecA-family ATPase